ncbi:hypothetical protein AB4072_13940 [Microvirga sp. 2MCAF38]|uniref:hypothetical protein n=1 Tax=Microvirga sp. 2MCAF38 TaxID=3232989 RepID=UPI003F97A64D
MLSSPLIMVDDQKPLRDELVRELSTIEQDFVSLPARNVTEVSAKIDVAKSALREGLQGGQSWLVSLLSSIQTDLNATNAKAPTMGASRTTSNLTRTDQSRHAVQAITETETSNAA